MRSSGTPIGPGVKCTSIVARHDELVSPFTSGIEPGMTKYTVQDWCALDPAHPQSIPCRLVLPFVGTTP